MNLLRQEPASRPEDRAETFQPHEGGSNVAPGEVLLVEAYAAMWLLAFVLILLSYFRQKRLEERLERLREDLARAREGAG